MREVKLFLILLEKKFRLYSLALMMLEFCVYLRVIYFLVIYSC